MTREHAARLAYWEVDTYNRAVGELEARGFAVTRELEVQHPQCGVMNCYTLGEVVAFAAGIKFCDKWIFRVRHALEDAPLPKDITVVPQERADDAT